MTQKKCLILGGNGFIGKNLVKHLSTMNYRVTSFDKILPEDNIKCVNYIQGDFMSDISLQESIKGQDVIVHLISTITPRSPLVAQLEAYRTDVYQTVKILEYIKDTQAKLIFASSGGTVYGQPKTLPVSEEHATRPIVHYGMIKVIIENLIFMYNLMFGMKNIVLRLSNPYGPGQDYKHGVGIINALLKNYADNKPTTIWGDGTATKDYIYIDDLCEYIEKTIEYEGGTEVFNIGSGVGTSVNEIITIINKILREKLVEEYTAALNNDVKNIILDTKIAQRELRFKPRYDINSGIKKYIEYAGLK